MTEPAVSVVVATRNRAAKLGRLLDALERQDGAPAFEVVVVDDASTDDTWARLSGWASDRTWLHPVHRDRRGGPGAARNSGWRTAAAPLVAFIDDDCVPARDWLARITAALDGADIAQGPVRPAPDQLTDTGPFRRIVGVECENGLYETCNIAYRIAWLDRVGGFDESFRRSGEDADLAWRAKALGAISVWSPDSTVFHDVDPSSYPDRLRDTLRWTGVVELVARHPHLTGRFGTGRTWRRAHGPALAAAAGFGMLGAAVATRRRTGLVLGTFALLPYVRFRLTVEPVTPSWSGRVRYLPAAWTLDLAEVLVIDASRARLLLRRARDYRRPAG